MKKSLALIVLMALAPTVVLAQTAPAKPAVKPAAKAVTVPGQSSKIAPGAVKAVEEATPVDDDTSITLSEADLAMAGKVHVGAMPCELGATVSVTAAPRTGFFTVVTKGHRFRMHPVESRTGAIRLEDPRQGAMWLQLGNKSMLMSQKLGQRLADECQSPAQLAVAEHLKKNPAPSLLEPLPPAK